jgi:hypothetical protein
VLERLKDECEEFLAVMSISPRLLVAVWSTVLSPGALMLGSLFIPGELQADLVGRMFDPILTVVRDAVPWAALAVFLYFSFVTADVYQRERARLLDL